MLLRVNPDNIREQDIELICDTLKRGGIIIYPTDSVYGLGCDIFNHRAIEKICRLKKIDQSNANFTFICSDLSHLSDFSKPIPNPVFRIMKKALPGPYTFILQANNQVPKLLKQNKKTIGIRVPDNAICKAIIEKLGHPILSSSLHDSDDEILDYYTDPEIIHQREGDKVDLVIDGGHGNIFPSTVIDCSGDEPKILREGLGSTDILE